MRKRKICIFTGTRAEYGLLKPLIDELKIEKSFEVQLLISGMHLSPEFGLTVKEIEQDGFSKVEKVEILLSSDTAIGVSKAMGLGMISYSEVLERLKPDLIIGLGDRFELFALVCAALVQKIPIAHVHGGEVTTGAYDNAFRHSITKMSHLHFASTEIYKRRIIQLGENPNTVFNVGALGLDNIKRLKLLSRKELENSISFKLDKPYFIVTFHPVTLENNSAEQQIKELIRSLEKFKDYKILFTKPNCDNESRKIIELINEFEKKYSDRVKVFDSLGQLRYLSALKNAEMMIGNSSSGIIEMPYFKKPTVNIGDRQKGRIFPASVLQCEANEIEITNTIIRALKLRRALVNKKINNIYGDGTAARRIKKILLKTEFNALIKKEFYDIKIYNKNYS